MPVQKEMYKKQKEEQEKEADKQYSRAMAKYVREQAEHELQSHRTNVERERQLAAKIHAEVLGRNFQI